MKGRNLSSVDALLLQHNVLNSISRKQSIMFKQLSLHATLSKICCGKTVFFALNSFQTFVTNFISSLQSFMLVDVANG